MIQKEKPSLALFHETKMSEYDLRLKPITLWNKSSMAVIDTRGASRGICTLWDPNQLQLLQVKKTTRWLATSFRIIGLQQICNIINLYMLNHFREEQE